MKTNKAIQTLINRQAHKLSLLYYVTARESIRQRLELMADAGATDEQLKIEITSHQVVATMA